MIDQSLVDRVESYIIDGRDLPVSVAENILDAYVKLIEQNADLHKQSEKYKSQIKSILLCDTMNTGHEPSLSFFQREMKIVDCGKEK